MKDTDERLVVKASEVQVGDRIVGFGTVTHVNNTTRITFEGDRIATRGWPSAQPLHVSRPIPTVTVEIPRALVNEVLTGSPHAITRLCRAVRDSVPV